MFSSLDFDMHTIFEFLLLVCENFLFMYCPMYQSCATLVFWLVYVLFLHQPLKWELKQRPGMSPPRGGFQPDDPNQQIIADDIFDEYGGIVAVS